LARILVTGAAGFIGRTLCPALARAGHSVLAVTRDGALPGIESRPLGEIGPATDWSAALHGVEIVVHLANRAHRAAAPVMEREPAAAAALAAAAARAGVRRLVQMSSVKVMGEATAPGRPFRPQDAPCPADAYGRVKLASERALQAAAAATGLELVVLRPPLVYGPGVGGNFAALLRLVASGVPLPLAGIDNRRSLVHIGNLCDLVGRAVAEPAAAERILLVRDGEDLSTADLVRVLAAGLGRPARLVAAPHALLALLRRLPRLGPAAARLTLSLQVDDGATRAALGWRPAIAARDGLAATARAFAAGM